MSLIRYKPFCVTMLISILACTGLSISEAMDLKKQSLYAAFILNFARFSEWPDNTSYENAKEFQICLVSYSRAAGVENLHIAKQLNGKKIGKKIVTTKIISKNDSLNFCQIIYTNNIKNTLLISYLSQVANQPILTIANSSNYLGGIIELFEKEGKVRFSVSNTALQKTNIKISSRILKLAVITQ